MPIFEKSACVLCGNSEQLYLFSNASHERITCCSRCQLLRAESKASDSLPEPNIEILEDSTEKDAVDGYVDFLRTFGVTVGRVLFYGPPHEKLFRRALEAKGFQITDISEVNFAESTTRFDLVVCYRTLECSQNPDVLLKNLNGCLREKGRLMLVTTAVDSLPAKVFGRRWLGWNAGISHFFTAATRQMLLEKYGFKNIIAKPGKREYRLSAVAEASDRVPGRFKRQSLKAVLGAMPQAVMKRRVQIAASAMVVLAERCAIETRQKLSIIIPVFNEKDTFMELFQAIKAKSFEGIDEVEYIVVESNSTDGSRELVQSIAAPDVRIILQDKPQGKGNAVREGLKQATGHIIAIQDADLEYDIQDYDGLLKPILNYERVFVLGTRHSGDWKIRKFTEQPVLAILCNLAHIFFATLMNVLYGQSMSDPFTMFKIFRRECVYGLNFECNRFDFDHELVIKLVRKGFTPLEIPVNYKARSFAEGKKVTFFRDPLTWIKANFKYRFVTPYDLNVVQPPVVALPIDVEYRTEVIETGVNESR